MTETIRYSLIAKEDINFGTGTFSVTLADGRTVNLSQLDLAVILNDATKHSFLKFNASVNGITNVKEYGAAGDGNTHDSTAINNAILNCSGVLYFPPGVYVIDSTLLFENMQGLVVLGSGSGGSASFGTQLLWAGNNSTPLLRIFGCRDSIFENFQIKSTSSTPLQTAIQLETRSGSVSTNNQFKNIIANGTSSGGLNYGVRCVAGTGGNANNDEMLFDHVVINNYDTVAYSFEHSQSAVHKFIGSQFSGASGAASSIGVSAVGGSSMTWIGGGGGGNTNCDLYVIGSNLPNTFIGLASEGSAKFYKGIVGATSSTVPVIFESCSFNSNSLSDNKIFEFYGRMLKISNMSILNNGGIPAEIYVNTDIYVDNTFIIENVQMITTLTQPFTSNLPTSSQGVFIGSPSPTTVYRTKTFTQTWESFFAS